MVATRSKMGRWSSWRRRKRSVRKKGKEELLPAGIKVEARVTGDGGAGEPVDHVRGTRVVMTQY